MVSLLLLPVKLAVPPFAAVITCEEYVADEEVLSSIFSTRELNASATLPASYLSRISPFFEFVASLSSLASFFSQAQFISKRAASINRVTFFMVMDFVFL